MPKKKIVVALGGNALGNTPREQIASVNKAAEIIADLAIEGHDIVIGHGNGPQVGMINLAMDYSAHGEPCTPSIPLAECGAMSQGYIGYHLQQALQKCICDRNIHRDVVSVITQVVVDQNDSSFKNPSKPIGMFYTKDEAEAITEKKGYSFVEDSGRGYRRVVPSPKPRRIVEINAIRRMIQDNMIVITVGGGGIPVVETNGNYRGVDAVVDKDMSCSKLAQELHADTLLILTAVDQVYINFNSPAQQALSYITTDEARRYIEEGQFSPGSMLPKVEACIDFVQALSGHTAIITSLSKACSAIKGLTGTVISA